MIQLETGRSNALISNKPSADTNNLTLHDDSNIESPTICEQQESKMSRLEELVEFVLEKREAKLYCSSDGQPFVVLKLNGQEHVWYLSSRTFKNWLRTRGRDEIGFSIIRHMVSEVVEHLSALAELQGQVRQVFQRIGYSDTAIYLDLCNDDGEAVEITKDGWKIIQNPPIYFTRGVDAQALPHPQSPGNLGLLDNLINVQPSDMILVKAFLLACFSQDVPYPILILLGKKGSAKSTGAKYLRQLIDPNNAPLRSPQNKEQDLAISAQNSFIICWDNASLISHGMSDSLCRLATGGAYAGRKLYTDSDEVVTAYRRPCILNGIDIPGLRSDALDRSIVLHMPQLQNQRHTQKNLDDTFKKYHPQILAGLLDAVSIALKNYGTTYINENIRMLDFATWTVAAEEGLGAPQGSFLKAYHGNRLAADMLAIEASPTAYLLWQFVHDHRGIWQGTAAKLLHDLQAVCEKYSVNKNQLPNYPRGMRQVLKNFSDNFERCGLFEESLGKPNGVEHFQLVCSMNAPNNV